MLKLSIITPNYNYGMYLEQLIESVRDQDYENWEHIIVDDGSTDNSVDVIEKYAGKDKRIRLIKQENRGQTKALNRALESVSGDLIAWINSDDWYCKSVFKDIVREFEENEHLDILYGDGYYYKVQSNEIVPRKQLPFNYKLFTFTGFCNSVMSNTIVWKSDLLSETGCFNEHLVYNMDGEYFARLFWNRKIKHIRLPIAHFRWHSEAKTIKNQKSNRSIKYTDEMNAELSIALKNIGRMKLINSNLLKSYKKFYKMKRICMRLLLGQYV